MDWESALLAPPERDLWALAVSDPGLLDAYSAATGTTIDIDALALYRMWYDLAEISLYVRWFRSSHDNTADAAEGWQNLQDYLRPAQRWPDLLTRPAAGTWPGPLRGMDAAALASGQAATGTDPALGNTAT